MTQNRRLKVEIKGFKTSHFGTETAPQDHADAGPMGHVECPYSESASHDIEHSSHEKRLVPRWIAASLGLIERPLDGICGWEPAISTTGVEGTGEAKPAISITGKSGGRKSQCEPLAEAIMAKVHLFRFDLDLENAPRKTGSLPFAFDWCSLVPRSHKPNANYNLLKPNLPIPLNTFT